MCQVLLKKKYVKKLPDPKSITKTPIDITSCHNNLLPFKSDGTSLNNEPLQLNSTIATAFPASTSVNSDLSKGVDNHIVIMNNISNKILSDSNRLPKLHPILPLHKKWENYQIKRNEIFNLSCLSNKISKKPKRSTLRLRYYYKNRKFTSKFILSAIVSNNSDKR